MASRTVSSSGVRGGDESCPHTSCGFSSAGPSTACGQDRHGVQLSECDLCLCRMSEPPSSFSIRVGVFSDFKTNKLK